MKIKSKRQRKPPMDCFGNVIEVGDRFFYGIPTPYVGIVTEIKIKTIRMELRQGKFSRKNCMMNCKTPQNGVCLDKIPCREHYETQPPVV